MFTKTVGYAYPSSPMAEKLGHTREGCFYSARRTDRHYVPKLAKPFGTLREAIADAEKRFPEYPWNALET